MLHQHVAISIWLHFLCLICTPLPSGYPASVRLKWNLRSRALGPTLPSHGVWPQAVVDTLPGVNFVAGCWGLFIYFKLFFFFELYKLYTHMFMFKMKMSKLVWNSHSCVLHTAARVTHITSLAQKCLVILHLRGRTNTHKWSTGYCTLWPLILSFTSSPTPPLRLSTPSILAFSLS